MKILKNLCKYYVCAKASNHRSSCIQEEQQLVKIFLDKWNIVNSDGIIQSSQQL
jgi:hypothetical protein